MNIRHFHFIGSLVVVLSLWTAALAQSSGFDTGRLDRSADPCNDFFQFANGTWLKNTEIPPSQASWGSFSILADSNREVLRNILESAAKTKAPKGSNMQLIGDFYASCMDEAAEVGTPTTSRSGRVEPEASQSSAVDHAGSVIMPPGYRRPSTVYRRLWTVD